MTENTTEKPMYLVPGRLTKAQISIANSSLYNPGTLAPMEAVIDAIGTPIQPCADVKTVCREHITDTDEIRPGVSSLVLRQGAELVRRVDMEAQVTKVRADAMRQGYLLGFNSSGEGWNGEYPFKDNAQNPDEDADWLQGRDDNIRAALDGGEPA